MERAAAGDWPVLVPGGRAEGLLTELLSDAARARLDWYEVAFGYVPEAVEVESDGAIPALVYREVGGGGSGEPWDLAAWIKRHGARTRLAAEEVMRAHGRVSPEALQARRPMIHARAHGMLMAQADRRPVTVGGPPPGRIEVARVDYPYEGFLRVEEWVLDHPHFDGSRSGQIHRTLTHVTNAATVLPYDPVRDRVLMVEQIRLGALAKGEAAPWMLEPIAGLIDAGETAASTALREAREEAGLELGPEALHPVATYYPSPGGLAQIVYSFVALADLPEGTGGLHGLDHEAEDIRSHLVDLDHALSMIATGEAANAPLILSLQWIALNRERLKAD
ncbi:nudix-type nucleoside diphosphatase, YffH/AdpP family [Jannaschia seohaensis]|uniref:ADP-ribose pyrophosphatase n=1 Tax=Jannaschia seohaensis TaxID=475081 RepID=A0A2Y9AJX0_9RHOB|nr:nudix-type nucleoside diphosphatase (YffH/AdpP family) [Jannaschia seohaensis]SSA44620.1 nudix-type nucleoside diphosphatase, YffH/AdpP family [Jannaschia seohaensis]